MGQRFFVRYVGNDISSKNHCHWHAASRTVIVSVEWLSLTMFTTTTTVDIQT